MKKFTEAAEAVLFTADGKIDYQTAECSLKGRGNSTWDLFEKKPYQLKLDETYAGSYAVKKGERFCDLSVPKITEEDVIWANCENGEVFDPEQIITEDITLIPVRDDDSQG